MTHPSAAELFKNAIVRNDVVSHRMPPPWRAPIIGSMAREVNDGAGFPAAVRMASEEFQQLLDAARHTG